METHLPPVPQLPLQYAVQGKRDNVVQILNLEKAEVFIYYVLIVRSFIRHKGEISSGSHKALGNRLICQSVYQKLVTNLKPVSDSQVPGPFLTPCGLTAHFPLKKAQARVQEGDDVLGQVDYLLILLPLSKSIFLTYLSTFGLGEGERMST